MTPAQKIQVRQAQIRSRLTQIAHLPKDEQEASAITAEVVALNAELDSLPAKLEQAFIAEAQDARLRGEQNTQDGEYGEMAGVMAQASVGDFMANIFNKQAHSGPLAELQAHYGLGRDELPIDMLRTGDVFAAVTEAPANVRRTENPTVMPVFAGGDAAFLNVTMPTQEAGDATFPVLTSRPTVHGPYAASEEAAETDGTFEAEVLQPERIQASFRWRRRDAVRFPMMSSDLRSALARGLSEKLDAEVVGQIVTDVTHTDASAVDDFASYRKRMVFDRLDGRYATMESAIKVLVGAPTLAHMSGAYRSNNADDSAVDSVRRISGGMKISDHIADVASNKQDSIIRRGARRDMVCPLWRGITVLFDEITRAAYGEIVITGVMMFNKKVIRTEGFAVVETQHGS